MEIGLLTCILFADWTQEETEVPGDNTHLWEESWDDDDTSEDFSAQLKWVFLWDLVVNNKLIYLGREELKKVEAGKKR
jgi:hypothetical protein